MIWQFGSTPLMEASKRNHIEVIELLLNADANKDVQDVSRWFLAADIYSLIKIKCYTEKISNYRTMATQH